MPKRLYGISFSSVGFQVLTAVSMKMTVFWVAAPCSLVEVYRLHGATTQKTVIFIVQLNKINILYRPNVYLFGTWLFSPSINAFNIRLHNKRLGNVMTIIFWRTRLHVFNYCPTDFLNGIAYSLFVSDSFLECHIITDSLTFGCHCVVRPSKCTTCFGTNISKKKNENLCINSLLAVNTRTQPTN
jgi:hypothetical protein